MSKHNYDNIKNMVANIFGGGDKNISIEVHHNDEKYDDEPVYMWSSMDDEKTCKYCRNMDGKVFTRESAMSLDKQPGEAHDGCRCVWARFTGDNKPKPMI